MDETSDAHVRDVTGAGARDSRAAERCAPSVILGGVSSLSAVPMHKRRQVAATLGLFAVLLIAVGAFAGGWLGSHYGRRIPPRPLRWTVVVVGTSAALVMALT